jgi:hypothetical protein
MDDTIFQNGRDVEREEEKTALCPPAIKVSTRWVGCTTTGSVSNAGRGTGACWAFEQETGRTNTMNKNKKTEPQTQLDWTKYNELLAMFGRLLYAGSATRRLTPHAVVVNVRCECHGTPARKVWSVGREFFGECAESGDILRVVTY